MEENFLQKLILLKPLISSIKSFYESPTFFSFKVWLVSKLEPLKKPHKFELTLYLSQIYSNRDSWKISIDLKKIGLLVVWKTDG